MKIMLWRSSKFVSWTGQGDKVLWKTLESAQLVFECELDLLPSSSTHFASWYPRLDLHVDRILPRLLDEMQESDWLPMSPATFAPTTPRHSWRLWQPLNQCLFHTNLWITSWTSFNQIWLPSRNALKVTPSSPNLLNATFMLKLPSMTTCKPLIDWPVWGLANSPRSSPRSPTSLITYADWQFM